MSLHRGRDVKVATLSGADDGADAGVGAWASERTGRPATAGPPSAQASANNSTTRRCAMRRARDPINRRRLQRRPCLLLRCAARSPCGAASTRCERAERGDRVLHREAEEGVAWHHSNRSKSLERLGSFMTREGDGNKASTAPAVGGAARTSSQPRKTRPTDAAASRGRADAGVPQASMRVCAHARTAACARARGNGGRSTRTGAA